MKNHYYVDDAGNVQGPVSPEQLQALHRNGQISAATQVCAEGTEQWLPYFKAPEAQVVKKNQQKPPALESKLPSKSVQESTFTASTPATYMTKIQGNILIALLLIGLGAPFWLFLKPTPKWEYVTLEVVAETPSGIYDDNLKKLAYKSVPDIQSKIEALGENGWELVTVYLEHETAHPNFGKEDLVTGLQPNVRPQSLVCIFKRQKKL
jgi:hypothetical protein